MVLICLLVIISAVEAATGHRAPPAGRPRASVARVYFDQPSRVQELVNTLDVWEVRRERGYVVALLTPGDVARLTRAGLFVEIDQRRTEAMLSPPGFPCYSDVNGLVARMNGLAAAHPAIVELSDIGDTWQGDDMWMLRLTNRAIPGPKPVFFLMAAIHAREMTTSEVALNLAEHLVTGYGTDADATWLLDHHEIRVVPLSNPDGRRVADAGYLQRKNLNDTNGGGCAEPPTASNQFGTDLNRNSSWGWNCCGGSSASPCTQTYHGATPASEPETAALQNQILSLFPDQRGTHQNDSAPLDATGIMITLHSYGRQVLWPWGDVFPAAPNGNDLELLGGVFASFNGYTPMQASDLYITDGTTDDWSYGELGVASFTFEMGTDFFESCAALPGIEQENLGALLYAARVARAPYRLGRGPDVTQIAVTASTVVTGAPAALNAVVDDAVHGGVNIASARYYIDLPPWQGGTPVPMLPADGALNTPTETVTASLDTASIGPGRHLLFVQGVDTSGNAGAVRAAFLTVLPPGGTAVSGLEILPGAAPGQLLLTWAAVPGAVTYRVAAGALAGIYDHGYIACGLTATSIQVPSLASDSYYLVEAVLPGPLAGGLGTDSEGVERPEASGECP